VIDLEFRFPVLRFEGFLFQPNIFLTETRVRGGQCKFEYWAETWGQHTGLMWDLDIAFLDYAGSIVSWVVPGSLYIVKGYAPYPITYVKDLPGSGQEAPKFRAQSNEIVAARLGVWGWVEAN
jgi:hypothetical protein